MIEGKTVKVIGGGLAGVEAAAQLSSAGIPVELYEMKPVRFSPAHKSSGLAELVCSNSLKAMRPESAAGLLKLEMQKLGSVCVEAALKSSVPAGGALAVDRDAFSEIITHRLENDPMITVIREEITEIPSGVCIVAAGPLASDSISDSISSVCGDGLHFYDAAAPIVSFESIDMTKAFFASRYGRGDDDYINCPMNREEYEAFYEALVNGERARLHSFDERKEIYEGCMPIEVMAGRGADTIRFGPMKPVGLTDPNTGKRPWAVLQLRKENSEGSMYNLVGFQTNLTFPEQKRIFSMIPALHDAQFLRYGVMHRNTFIDSPGILSADFSVRNRPELFFAGQITGVEGYMESAASGILAGINAAARIKGESPFILPEITMMGALSRYISDESVKDFQPMGASFGLLPGIEPRIRDKAQRGRALSERSLSEIDRILSENRAGET